MINEIRLKQAEASVRRTRDEFDELAVRAVDLDAQLEGLSEPPRLARALAMLLVLAIGMFAGLIGVLAWWG